MPWTQDDTCGNCKFFGPPVAGEKAGTCRREPPDVVVDPKLPNLTRRIARWPDTTASTPRCGQWQQDGAQSPGHLVTLPLSPSGSVVVNPAFTLAVLPLTASTCRLTQAGINNVTIALSAADTLELLASA